jgi:adenylate kinase
MQKGQLVPDEMVNRMVQYRLLKPDTLRGYILDGYPRTIGQANWLDVYVLTSDAYNGLRASLGQEGGAVQKLPVVAVNVRVEYTQLLRRVTGRRLCPTCGSIYNVYLHPPKVEGMCDLDGTTLTRRNDDTEAVFEGRMRSYEAQTAPVVGHYKAQDRMVEVDGEQPVEQVTAAVVEAIKRLRGA